MKPLFRDRLHAGEVLSHSLKLPENSVIFAIPRGGVPVAYPVAVRHNIPMDIIVVRKLPIPWNPEAGFGAVTIDGTIFLNPDFENLIDRKTINEVGREVFKEVLRRNLIYREGKGYKPLNGKTAIIIDDGFASGFTAIAASNFLKTLNPEKILAVAPVAPIHTIERLKPYFDKVLVLHESTQLPFAVASFYESFPDLTDEEVLAYIDNLKERKLWWNDAV
ncbi:phosphoribosyltransferase [Desulfurobacterium atlanticum]|uniref:Predicted phosphoribosyltransferase n=1 Tax=Desulfurobacterium atlanticum TaxID=240169 RepID=A0A238XMM3_9BACT|nr:phosphoribosyltransferase family protein [Desulfurobacterium atlanticum]SNR59604.1 Predicted phosphoribosyltransferase [Desulfurobacterium atlanticum]